jgi:hypothetical protein
MAIILGHRRIVVLFVFASFLLLVISLHDLLLAIPRPLVPIATISGNLGDRTPSEEDSEGLEESLRERSAHFLKK